MSPCRFTRDGKAIATAGIKLSLADAYAQEEQLKDKAIATLTQTTLIIILAASLIGIGLSLLLSRQITRPLRQVIQNIHEMANGDIKAFSTELIALSRGDFDPSVNYYEEGNQY